MYHTNILKKSNILKNKKISFLKCLSMSDVNLDNKRILIREDLNVPMENGKIRNDEKIIRVLPTIKKALKANGRVIILSHLGRPEEGKFNPAFSLAPIREALSKKLNCKVALVKNWLDGGLTVKSEAVVLCENVRFNVGEYDNDSVLAQRMAKLCDVFVMDAFATAHRIQASTVGVSEYAPIACAGPLLISEIKALSSLWALHNPKKLVVAIVGGAKVSSKIYLLENLLDKIDQLIVGGGIANTFLKAKGYAIGKSLCEHEWLDHAGQFWEKVVEKKISIQLPIDVIVSSQLSKDAKSIVKTVDAISDNEIIFDIGPKTSARYARLIAQAGTIVWNGPVGVFEIEAFSQGTCALAQAIADSDAYSIAGGGDTLAALDQYGLKDQLSYISIAGGAFLEFLQGKTLPAIEILIQRAKLYE